MLKETIDYSLPGPLTGRKIVILDDTELADDLVRDMTETLTSFCARLYGRRSAARKAKAALAAAQTTL